MAATTVAPRESPESPVAVLMSAGKLKEKPQQLKEAWSKWVVCQPPWVEAVALGLWGGAQGAFFGSLMGSLVKSNLDQGASAGGPQAQMMKMGGPWQQARNFAVITGVNAGLGAFMKRVRKVDDAQNSMVAGFGAGAAFSLVSGIGAPPPVPGGAAPNPVMAAFSAGMGFALFNGLFYKLGDAFGGPKSTDTEYLRVKAMLTNLGLQKYERNCKKSLLTDATIMLWDTTALQEARIPAGPRLLILHHINQYRGALGEKTTVSEVLSPALPIAGLYQGDAVALKNV